MLGFISTLYMRTWEDCFWGKHVQLADVYGLQVMRVNDGVLWIDCSFAMLSK
jgi:hypothetical protein